ncbi:acylphosphatase [Pseudolabrys sp. Root1462]|jgi:acylphosphatase|uniref:acylphosphatase n=1 Tax=Pseudolabrys sp. Root1462 TaxID=1736466 RepID=UPI000703A7AA|nr:acylphosphatase [Pseudolabrys sp. Root1462]KQZ00616.1 acylphosphatase [Pseudolabrys sp. Root1462]
MIEEVVVHLIVHGRVQGVGYRAFVEREATRRDLQGWVRNCADGTVEALLTGNAAVVEDMIAACRRGPFGARVDAIERAPGHASALKDRRPGQAFSVLPTI